MEAETDAAPPSGQIGAVVIALQGGSRQGGDTRFCRPVVAEPIFAEGELAEQFPVFIVQAEGPACGR